MQFQGKSSGMNAAARELAWSEVKAFRSDTKHTFRQNKTGLAVDLSRLRTVLPHECGSLCHNRVSGLTPESCCSEAQFLKPVAAESWNFVCGFLRSCDVVGQVNIADPSLHVMQNPDFVFKTHTKWSVNLSCLVHQCWF